MTDTLTGVTLRDYQQRAVDQIGDLYATGHTRASCQLPCGTGKTAVAAALSAGYDTVCVFVPTVALLAQTVASYSEMLPAVEIAAVCSPAAHLDHAAEFDGDVDELDADALESVLDELDASTDPDVLAAHLRQRRDPLVVVSTYASAGVVAAATAATATTWDLLICDEAHRTAGAADKTWGMVLHDSELPARRRLFTTATARLVEPPKSEDGEYIEVASMNDPALYGPVLPALSVREAIDAGWLSDYQVAIIAVTDEQVAEVIADARASGHILDANAAATQLALLRAAEDDPQLDSVLAFHNRIAQSRAWTAQLRALAKLDPAARRLRAFHIDAGTHATHRTAALNRLTYPHGDLAVVSNVQVLAEGIDLPGLAAVLFAAPRTGAADITQIVGRALRRHPEHPGRTATIVVPVVEPSNSSETPDDRLARSRYAGAWRILAALADDDPILYQSLVQIRSDADSSGPAPAKKLRIDTSMLPANAADGFRLRVLARTTSGHGDTALRLANFAAEAGHANPPSRYRGRDGTPLASRVRAARRAYQAGTLHSAVIDMFEQIPGFTWEPSTKTVTAGADRMLDVLEHYLDVTGTTTVPEWVTTVDPATDRSVRLGRWVANPPQTLTTTQRQRLNELLS